MPGTIEIFADTRGISPCTGRTCGRRILWAQVVKSGKRMCFDDLELPALSTRHDPASNRLIETVDLTVNHWATCPDARAFNRSQADRRKAESMRATARSKKDSSQS
jgi:hypothetical protein